MYEAKGQHVIVDVTNVDPELLDDLNELQKILHEAAQIAGTTVLSEVWHQFQPCGVTGVLLLSESHLSIHTYPEYGSAFLDMFTCGECDPVEAMFYILEQFKVGDSDVSFTAMTREI